MDGSIAHPLFEKLKEEGYLVPASGSHKAGFKNSGKPPWVPAAGDASTHKMLDEYFNPIHNVEEYVSPLPKLQHAVLTEHSSSLAPSILLGSQTSSPYLERQNFQTQQHH